MVDPTLTISIDRSGMTGAPAPLVLSAVTGTTLGITYYEEPALQSRVRYAADSPWIHGSTAIAATWQQSMLNFDVTADVDDEAALRAAIADLRAALGQFTYATTVTVSGQADVWRCDMGSLSSAPRTLENLAQSNPVYSAAIPVYPIAS